MFKAAPRDVISGGTFRNETMDMWIPFQITTKGMQDTDKTGYKLTFMIDIIEKT